ncbi:hypothetical protein F4806DRAFT_476278 [Annulohypoxylon nitens]|nr:hypothetical protein F4806DRAFT_476278 [Annulohypoxylon nitens]
MEVSLNWERVCWCVCTIWLCSADIVLDEKLGLKKDVGQEGLGRGYVNSRAVEDSRVYAGSDCQIVAMMIRVSTSNDAFEFRG